MFLLDTVINYIIPFLAVLTLLVFVHEWGHYWVAVRNGVRVEAFAIGFGPEIWGREDKRGTRWKICALPLGGYVKMFGEGIKSADDEPDADDDSRVQQWSDEERACAFSEKTLLQRSAIVFAGPLANFVFAAFLFFMLSWLVGNPQLKTVIGNVEENSPAAAAGLLVGDEIVTLDGVPTPSFRDLQAAVVARPGQTVALDIRRTGKAMALDVTLMRVAQDSSGEAIGRIGIRPDVAMVEYTPLPFFQAFGDGITRTVSMIGQIFAYLWDIISGVRGTEDLGGPLRIAQLSGDIAQVGLTSLVFFMAALSVNLGLINLFPIPVLDGGHLLFYAMEWVRGKPLNRRAQEYGTVAGMGLLLALFVFVTWNDLESMQVFGYLQGLFSRY